MLINRTHVKAKLNFIWEFYSKLLLAASMIVLLFLQSCKSFRLTGLTNFETQSEKLPPLEPELDVKSFGPNYADLYGLPGQILRAPSPDIIPNVVDNLAAKFTVAQDTRHIYDSYIIKHLCENVGETQGHAVCRMGLRSNGISSYLNPIVSILTLGIANVFGYKYATMKDELEIVVDVYNLDDKVIASYSGFGVGEANVQAYKGYTMKSAKRVAHARAFVNAMEEIKEAMLSQKNDLVLALAE